MKLVVFGSTGRVGGSVVTQALEAGHEVAAYARPASVGRLPAGVEVHAGELDDAAAIASAVSGADAVISGLGARENTADQVPMLTVAYECICQAMADAGVQRLVAISGSATRLPGERVSFGRGVMRVVMKLLGRHILRANEAAAEVILGTGLEWVLVRPPRIVDGGVTGERVADRDGTASMQITVGDVAAFMLESASSDEWVRAAPFVSAP
ncbi:MAG: NAD(P)H-binding protein [Planctomycetota bacterium]